MLYKIIIILTLFISEKTKKILIELGKKGIVLDEVAMLLVRVRKE